MSREKYVVELIGYDEAMEVYEFGLYIEGHDDIIDECDVWKREVSRSVEGAACEDGVNCASIKQDVLDEHFAIAEDYFRKRHKDNDRFYWESAK